MHWRPRVSCAINGHLVHQHHALFNDSIFVESTLEHNGRSHWSIYINCAATPGSGHFICGEALSRFKMSLMFQEWVDDYKAYANIPKTKTCYQIWPELIRYIRTIRTIQGDANVCWDGYFFWCRVSWANLSDQNQSPLIYFTISTVVNFSTVLFTRIVE